MANNRDDEGRWETLVELSTDIFTVVDETGTILYQSPAVEDILGYGQEELVGENAFDYVHPADQEEVLTAFDTILEDPGESTETVEYRIRHADGSWVWLETTGSNRKRSDWEGYVFTSREISTRKRREAELRETERRLSSVLDNIGLPVWMRTPDHEFVVVNEEYRRLFDIDDDVTIEGKTLRDIHEEETANSFEVNDRRVFEAGEPVEFEETVHLDEASLYYLTQVTPLFEEGGTPYATVGIATDITELREREAQLRERTKELEALHWTAETFASEDAPFEALLASLVEELPKWFQFPDRTVARLSYDDLELTTGEFDPDNRGITGSASTDDGATVELEIRLVEATETDDSVRFIEDERKLVRTLTTYIAETIGRRAQRRELRLFKRAVQAAGQAVFIADSDGVIEYVNPEFESHTGYSRTEAVGNTTRIHKSGRHEEEFYEGLWETIHSGVNWEGELINERKDGSLYYADVTVSPITDEDGTITHLVAIESEITDRRMREQQLDVLNRILRHNLRNSLTVLMGHTSLLEEELTGSDLRTSLDIVQKHVRTLEGLSRKTGQVRALFETHPTPDCVCDVSTILRDIEGRFSAVYPDVELTVSIPEPVLAHADDRLAVAIEEALENAIVHNDSSSPTVRVEATVRGDEGTKGVEVRICDDGPGIPDDQREIIESGAETSLEHGSGIGLWIIYWTVTMFGGEVTIESRSPRGSRVVLWLPAAEPVAGSSTG